jgi:multiple sugar transport system substrate-binding protein
MRRGLLAGAVAMMVLAVACTSSGGGGNAGNGATSGGSSNAPVNLTMWMGYTPPPPVSQSFENISLTGLVHEYETLHPNVHIDVRYVNSDFALQKATVALTGNKQPDISYQYGTNMPQLATAPKLVDLSQKVKDPGFNWNDFFPGERAVATVGGRVLGIPALVDNLAVVYNKDLFAKAGLTPPGPDWTWSELVADAKALTNTSQKQFGLAFPADGSETTVWEYEAMLWEAGGNILTPDNTKAAFNSAAGVRALTTLQQMQQDGSLYLDFHPDAGKSENLFNSGNIGMMITGPWDLSSFPDVKYGVQFMPSFDPGGSHQTIAGPDNWVIFDNGPQRVAAAWDFLKWFTAPDQLLKDSLATAHLPTRASVEQMPGFTQFNTKYPGTGTFAENLKNVLKARPQIPQYPRVSTALGQAIVNTLLGKGTPQDNLNTAASLANGFLAVPG